MKSARERAEDLCYGYYLPSKFMDIVEQALLESERIGEERAVEQRRGVTVHGSDDCSSCEYGRITIYAGTRICSECARG